MKKICFIVAVPGTAQSFLADHINALAEHYSVYLVANSEKPPQMNNLPLSGYNVVGISRNISIINDIKGVFSLMHFFRTMRFDAVHSVTPKAGLLTALAGFMARVPVRIHIFTGQVWAIKKGVARWLLKLMDKVIARLDTNILIDGEGQRQFLIQNKVVSEDKSRVLGKGSICGVNIDRFNPSKEVKNSIREELSISENSTVFVFLGRLNHDKGIYDLLRAFNKLAKTYPDVFLLLVGGDEEGVSQHFCEYNNLYPGKNFCYYGLTDKPHRLLQAGDVFVLPTYREGFGSSVIEASAMGLPVICSNAYGVMDAMVDNVTGIRCRVGDVDSLYMAMAAFINTPELIKRLGDTGRERVKRDFDGAQMTRLWVEFYQRIVPCD